VAPVDDDESDLVFWTTSGFTQPSTLSLADATQGPAGLSAAEPLRSLPAMFDASGQEVTQGMATSKDGTQVPYFMVKGPNPGPAPTLLYGYGGFRISLEASYASTVGAGWLERGGTFVQANIRGGGEFGPPWHAAALREKRHKAYEDMEAVAEALVARGVTTPAKLAVRGGSNGGLLVGNMLTRRPDLFGAVVCAVPLLDMRRYHKLLAGASWVGEYGDPDKDDDWAFLKHYSAYHQIDPKPTANYPPLLMTTSTRDDRVHPYHARSFVKRLQDVQAEGGVPAGSGQALYYYENVEGGHGGAADAKQQAFMTVLYLEFLKATIGKGGGLVDK
jgi:prolyl oligopeptidase